MTTKGMSCTRFKTVTKRSKLGKQFKARVCAKFK